MPLSPAAEEVATLYAKMLDSDYTTKEGFNRNFFDDWRKMMTPDEKEIVKEFVKCDFNEIAEHLEKVREEKKERTKEEKDREKVEKAAMKKKFGTCLMDGYRQGLAKFRSACVFKLSIILS